MKEFIKNRWCNILALFASLVMIGTFIYQQHVISVKSQEIAQYAQNWKALNDTLHVYELKNGELMASRAGYIMSNEKLCEQLNITKSELADIKSRLKSDPIVITKIQTEIVTDTIVLSTVGSTSSDIYFSTSNEWLNLRGSVKIDTIPAQAKLHNLSVPVPLTIGMTKDYQFFATSPNPYVNITDITGGIVEKYIPKKKHWSIGINAGFGAYYDLTHKTFGYGPGLNIGLQYNF